MAENYYSTQPFLAWILNHYFYSDKHFAWVGAPFYAYKRKNPRSSNPHRVYEDLYEMWLDQDKFDCHLDQLRMGLCTGVMAHIDKNLQLYQGLLKICNEIDIVFFYPIVYRIDLGQAKRDPIRQQHLIDDEGSAQFGSNEFKIYDLDVVNSYDVLFLDFENEALLMQNYPTRSQRIIDDMQDMLNGKLTAKEIYNVLVDYLVSPK